MKTYFILFLFMCLQSILITRPQKDETKNVCLSSPSFRYVVPISVFADKPFFFKKTISKECKKKSAKLTIIRKKIQDANNPHFLEAGRIYKKKIKKNARHFLNFHFDVLNNPEPTRIIKIEYEIEDDHLNPHKYANERKIIQSKLNYTRTRVMGEYLSFNGLKFKGRCVDICIQLNSEGLNVSDPDYIYFNVKNPFISWHGGEKT